MIQNVTHNPPLIINGNLSIDLNFENILPILDKLFIIHYVK
jgi:hypothetical protein